jgi:predicted Rossmann fold flavoprotein
MSHIVIIGGGAAGFFTAITCAESNPSHTVTLLEKSAQLLSKVRISGGGRCNVTHSCFDPRKLVQYYPRGNKEMLGPFNRFQPKDTIDWFEKRGVHLKTEDDGRMFPISDSSETIIDCLLAESKRHSVSIRTKCNVEKVDYDKGFILALKGGETIQCDQLVIATGSNPQGYEWAKQFGHQIVPPVPSLFTFNIPASPYLELSGVAMNPVKVSLEGITYTQTGPVLFTHWGLSGPAVIKLSAFGARYLHEKGYQAEVHLNFLPEATLDEVTNALISYKNKNGKKQVVTECPFSFPKSFWKKQLELAGIGSETWQYVSNKVLIQLSQSLQKTTLKLEGKTTYKEEFVTAGGVSLNEINFKTFQSKLNPNLYCVGEVLDIDGVTGGFNFQNAWTSGFLAGNSLGGQ